MTQEDFMKNRELFLKSKNKTAENALYKGLHNIGTYLLYKTELSTDERKDVLAEATAAAFGAMEKYRPDYKYNTWFGKIVSNKLNDLRRYRHSRGGNRNFSLDSAHVDAEGENYAFELEDKTESPFELLHKEQMKSLLHKAIECLPDGKMKKVMSMYVHEGKTNSEIMAELKMTKGMVAILIFRFKEILIGKFIGKRTNPLFR